MNLPGGFYKPPGLIHLDKIRSVSGGSRLQEARRAALPNGNVDGG